MSSGAAQFTSFPFKTIQPLKLHNLGRFQRHIIDKCFFPPYILSHVYSWGVKQLYNLQRGLVHLACVFLSGTGDIISEATGKGIWGLKAENSVARSGPLSPASKMKPGTCGTKRIPWPPNRHMFVGLVVKLWGKQSLFLEISSPLFSHPE